MTNCSGITKSVVKSRSRSRHDPMVFTRFHQASSTGLPRHRRIIGASLEDHPGRIDQRHLDETTKRFWRGCWEHIFLVHRMKKASHHSEWHMKHAVIGLWFSFAICLLPIRQPWSTCETNPTAPWSPVVPQKNGHRVKRWELILSDIELYRVRQCTVSQH